MSSSSVASASLALPAEWDSLQASPRRQRPRWREKTSQSEFTITVKSWLLTKKNGHCLRLACATVTAGAGCMLLAEGEIAGKVAL